MVSRMTSGTTMDEHFNMNVLEAEILVSGILNKLDALEIHIRTIANILYMIVGKEVYDSVLEQIYNDYKENYPENETRWQKGMSMLSSNQQSAVMNYVVDAIKKSNELNKLKKILYDD